MNQINICGRKVGEGCSPLVIAEIGINHEGDINKAYRMVDDAYDEVVQVVMNLFSMPWHFASLS